jgi:ammonium transporter, Amt family
VQAVDGKLADTVPTNTMFVFVAAVLVLFMQAGFAMLEIGFPRARNAGTGIGRILTNLSIAAICYWARRLRVCVGQRDAARDG